MAEAPKRPAATVQAPATAPEKKEGEEINPHIPQYIAQAPWYSVAEAQKATLAHQRLQRQTELGILKPAPLRGDQTVAGPPAVKYRKGACTNCGAMGHDAKTCTERPRAKGAKFLPVDIKPDEIVKSVELDYDGKRDRWSGYRPELYQTEVVEQFEKLEEARRNLKAKQLKQMMTNPGQGAGAVTPEEAAHALDEQDEFRESDDTSAQAQNVSSYDPKTRTAIRNLRIREDRAKYLYNLDVNSAYYDPKTRSMREAPNPGADPNTGAYMGDNFIRYSGETPAQQEQMVWAIKAADKGQDVHELAAPSQAMMAHEEFKRRKTELKAKTQNAVFEKYGHPEQEALPVELCLGQTEKYVEFGRDGRPLLQGGAATSRVLLARSKYEEDVFPLNHTAVWGSYWEAGRWGYACCHQFVKQSFCTGKAGRDANRISRGLPTEDEERRELALQEAKKKEAAAAAAAAAALEAASAVSSSVPPASSASLPEAAGAPSPASSAAPAPTPSSLSSTVSAPASPEKRQPCGATAAPPKGGEPPKEVAKKEADHEAIVVELAPAMEIEKAPAPAVKPEAPAAEAKKAEETAAPAGTSGAVDGQASVPPRKPASPKNSTSPKKRASKTKKGRVSEDESTSASSGSSESDSESGSSSDEESSSAGSDSDASSSVSSSSGSESERRKKKHDKARKASRKEKKKDKVRASRDDENASEGEEKRQKMAGKKHARASAAAESKMPVLGERRRKSKYSSMEAEHKVTPEEMEEYQRTRTRHEDPMANYVDEEDKQKR